MRFVVTGAAGFIGSHLVDRLLAEGHEVVGVDNLLTGSESNLAHLAGERRFVFVRADVCEWRPEPEGLARPVNGVFHLASPASPVDYARLPLETMRANSEGTWRMLELARALGARFLLASTSEAYGDPEVHPQTESYWGRVNPVGPRSVYDESKRFAEALAAAYSRLGLAEVRIARIFNTYGPRMRLGDGRVLPELICAAIRGEPMPVFGDGSQTRSFCYVSDMVDGLVRLFASSLEGPVNLGNEDEVSILDIAHEIRELSRSSSEIVFRPLPQDDPHRRRPDISRARRALGWEPRVPRRKGLELTLEDFRRRLALADNGARPGG